MFTKQLDDIKENARAFIKAIIDKRGDNYELCDVSMLDDTAESDDWDEINEILAELPVIVDNGCDYRVITIKEDYTLECVQSWPDDEFPLFQDESFPLDGLISADEICELADFILTLENQ